jgi:LmbE family N-acetylglucosaminyl deacetylase
LTLAVPGKRLKLLCIGAHSDDIEIGAGATILGLIAAGAKLDVHWVVLSATGERAAEAQLSAEALLKGSDAHRIELADFRDGFFPYQGGAIKEWMEGLRRRVEPDVILTHTRDDAHQDHREVSQLTTNTFRDHLVLEYEIPKWDGDLGRPNTYVAATQSIMDRKVALLQSHFASQRSKDWFDARTFTGLARLRGMECRAPDGFAEAFYVRKMLLV